MINNIFLSIINILIFLSALKFKVSDHLSHALGYSTELLFPWLILLPWISRVAASVMAVLSRRAEDCHEVFERESVQCPIGGLNERRQPGVLIKWHSGKQTSLSGLHEAEKPVCFSNLLATLHRHRTVTGES